MFPDAPEVDADQPALEDVPTFPLDLTYYYDNYYDVYDYWISVQP